jgi:dTDP-4-amino-4,6-dideoxygalactose transaminase
VRIPFNKIKLAGNELAYIKKAIAQCHLSGDGPYSQRCADHLERDFHPSKVFLTSSCTHSLELAAILADIKLGDEFIIPSYTFPSTANAFILRGAIPKFVDIRPDTFNIDEKRIERAITKKTKAICIVHYGGIPCEMSSIVRIARAHKLFLIEDAAQAFLSEYRGKKAGTFGDFGAISFHETKNIICGEGGALIINAKRFFKRAEILRQKGTNRASFYRGEVDKYTWVDIGSSYVPSELQAAFLAAQLEKRVHILKQRKIIWERYNEFLGPLEKKGSISLQKIPADCLSSHHLFAVVVESEKKRQSVLQKLKEKGIYGIFHYFPLHLSKMGRLFGYQKGILPVTERISQCLIRLPLYNGLDWPSQQYVLNTLIRQL